MPIHPEGVKLQWDEQAPRSYHEPTQSDLCKDWLLDLLQVSSTGIKVKEILEIGYEQGFSRPTIFRARRDMQMHIRNTHGRKSPDNSWKWFDVAFDAHDQDENEENEE